MPFKSDLLGLKNEHNCQIYLETGLYKINEKSSINQALKCKFDKVYSVELEKKWIDFATPQLKKYIDENKCELIHDDSANMEKYILNNTDFYNKRALFFLDAHIDNINIKTQYKFKCPVIAELTAISKLKRKDHIICIDDMRYIRTSSPWGETQFDNYYDEMIKILKEINKNYKIDFIKGVIERDILIAYV
tara:strand:- start:1533 stop:2105 length:573 start_codon:yes stop_codon:yes gene_type:complete